jgi:hypothetical protein
MIFGFNTDIKYEDTVYHVQSEARESEMVFETQVFVRGRCMAKRTSSYAEQALRGDFSDQDKEQRLREQHRLVLDAIREGRLDEVVNRRESSERLAAIKELDIVWLNAESIHTGDRLTMRLRATEGGEGLSGARLTVRLASAHADPFYTQITTNAAGEAELALLMDETSLEDCSVLVQVNAQGRTASRKFQLRRVEA